MQNANKHTYSFYRIILLNSVRSANTKSYKFKTVSTNAWYTLLYSLYKYWKGTPSHSVFFYCMSVMMVPTPDLIRYPYKESTFYECPLNLKYYISYAVHNKLLHILQQMKFWNPSNQSYSTCICTKGIKYQNATFKYQILYNIRLNILELLMSTSEIVFFYVCTSAQEILLCVNFESISFNDF